MVLAWALYCRRRESPPDRRREVVAMMDELDADRAPRASSRPSMLAVQWLGVTIGGMVASDAAGVQLGVLDDEKLIYGCASFVACRD
jgi:hypothetical protein